MNIPFLGLALAVLVGLGLLVRRLARRATAQVSSNGRRALVLAPGTYFFGGVPVADVRARVAGGPHDGHTVDISTRMRGGGPEFEAHCACGQRYNSRTQRGDPELAAMNTGQYDIQ